MNHPHSDNTQAHAVSVVSWWGYLNDPIKLAELETQCQAKIQVTEYKTSEDFFCLIDDNRFDLYIYPLYAYPQVSVLPQGPAIAEVARHYHPSIGQRYASEALSEDTVFFQHAVSALIYDSAEVAQPATLSAHEILDLSVQGQVMLQRDFEQVYWLLARDSDEAIQEVWDRLSDLVIRKRVQLVDFAEQLCQNNLVLGYFDSGAAHDPKTPWSHLRNTQGQPKALTMALHPQFSCVTTDLMSLKSRAPAALRVAQALAGRAFLAWVSANSYFYSPFGDLPKANHSCFIAGAYDFLTQVNSLPWYSVKDCTQEHHAYARQSWVQLMTVVNNPSTCARIEETSFS